MSILNLKDKDGNPICAATIIDDERSNKSKSSGSEKQFKDMYKETTRRQVRKRIDEGSIQDIVDSDGMEIIADMPDEDMTEYLFHHGQGGSRDMVHPGNDQFNKGDKIQRPPSGGGGGSGDGDASDSGEGEDDFTFGISKEEYMELLFEDLELPRQDHSKVAESLNEWKLKRAGFSTAGNPERLDVIESKKKNLARKVAMGVRTKQLVSDLTNRTIDALNVKLGSEGNFEELKLAASIALGAVDTVFKKLDPAITEKRRSETNYFALCESIVEVCREALESKRLTKVKAEGFVQKLSGMLDDLRSKMQSSKALTVMDESIDGRFKNFEKQPKPVIQAAMFCLMDVSGSMDQETKDKAKRFYVMLYLFLSYMYGDGNKSNVEIVFIRHHTQAAEVDEEEFFYGRETGGTIVSSGLKLINEIQRERFPADSWNIYVAQASDGDNWADDSPLCEDLVRQMLKSYVRYFVYIEITDRRQQSLWRHYQNLVNEDIGMFTDIIRNVSDIYPVFRKAFAKDIE